MKTVFSILVLALITTAVVAKADVILPAKEVTISGAQATKIANMMITGGDQQGVYAQGTASVSCVQKTSEKNFTCVIKAQ